MGESIAHLHNLWYRDEVQFLEEEFPGEDGDGVRRFAVSP